VLVGEGGVGGGGVRGQRSDLTLISSTTRNNKIGIERDATPAHKIESHLNGTTHLAPYALFMLELDKV
jgi:hypothetical protein